MSRARREEESKLLGAPPGPKKLASEGPSWEGWGCGRPWCPKAVMGVARWWAVLSGGRGLVMGVACNGWGSVMGGA